MPTHSSTLTSARAAPLVVTIVVLATALAFMAAPPAHAEHDQPTPARVSGQTRFATAAAVAALDHDTSRDVFIASGEDFPDALAASFAAGRAGAEDGPILLTQFRDLTNATRDALTRLSPRRVFVIGGPAAIHPDVVAELESRGYDEVVRVSGRDRYETAAAVAFGWGTGPFGNVGTLAGDRTALLASGAVFPDALAAGPVAGGAQLPLFLTPPDRPHPEVDRRLADLQIRRVVVIGGTAAVSSAVVRHYQNAGYEVERWGGSTRTDTAAVVAENARQRLGFDVTLTLLARGDNFPDALAASVHGGLRHAPILLTATPTILSAETRAWLAARCPNISAVRAVGGTAAVSRSTLGQAIDAAGQCLPKAHTQQSYIQAPQEARTGNPGDTFEVTVSGFDADNPAPVDIALFPCDVADPVDPNNNTFRDANGDRFADGIGTTTTGSAVIAHEHGADARHVDSVGPDQETNRFTYRLHSAAEDCVVNVVFHDANNNNQLDVDAQGRPLEHWNYGRHAWTRSQAHTQQSYIQAPQEARTGDPGDTFEVTVLGFDNPEQNPAPVDIALFPCDVADPVDPNNNTFRDANGDRFADGIGSSTTGSAVISSLHGDATNARHLDMVNPDANNRIVYTIHSAADDCVVNVVFHDANSNNQLDVDAEGRPLEHWNYGRHAWTS